MKLTWRDWMDGLLAVFGAVVVFAKLQDYTWWLIGSWKGALGVLAVTCLAMSVPYLKRLFMVENLTGVATLAVWLATATVVISELFVTTTKAGFVTSAIMIAISWLTIFSEDIWGSLHAPQHTHHLRTNHI